MQIMKYDAARQALAEARTIDDVKEISDKAQALQHYAKQVHDDDMERWLAEIKLRAMRSLGEITREIETAKEGVAGGGRKSNAGLSKQEKLKKSGITKQTASRCEKIAGMDEHLFEDEIEKAKKAKKPITYSQIEKKVKDIEKKTTVADKKTEYTQATAKSVNANPPTIKLADSLEYMKNAESDSIDLLLTDPPYSTDIDDIDSFSLWVLDAIKMLKPTGRAYICIGAYPKELNAYMNVLLNQQDKFIVDNPLIWTYRNTLGQTPKMKYNLNYQVILHLYSDKSPELDTSITNEMFSVQDINAPDGRLGDRYHTWQKPEELGLRLVRHSTQKNDIVFDPFACTGTFLIAASKLNRTSYGCELSEDNLSIAKERGCVNEQ